jgi:hypothetical protein
LYFFLDFERKLVKTCKNYNKNSAKFPNFKEKLRKFGAFGNNLPIFGLNYQKSEKFQGKENLISKICAFGCNFFRLATVKKVKIFNEKLAKFQKIFVATPIGAATWGLW